MHAGSVQGGGSGSRELGPDTYAVLGENVRVIWIWRKARGLSKRSKVLPGSSVLTLRRTGKERVVPSLRSHTLWS